jgi:hypothetical protein
VILTLRQIYGWNPRPAEIWVHVDANGEDAHLALRLGEAAGFVQITAPSTFAYREHVDSAMKDMKRTLAGAWSKVRAEQEGRYPGGRARAAERLQILTRHIRPVTLGCLREGFRRDAWALYASAFGWNASAGRLKYLAAFSFFAIAEEFRYPKIGGSIRA